MKRVEEGKEGWGDWRNKKRIEEEARWNNSTESLGCISPQKYANAEGERQSHKNACPDICACLQNRRAY